jgi:hypothetical protein
MDTTRVALHQRQAAQTPCAQTPDDRQQVRRDVGGSLQLSAERPTATAAAVSWRGEQRQNPKHCLLASENGAPGKLEQASL